MDEAKYLLDANVFINAARQYYAFDFAPGFWDALIQHSRRGCIQSIDHVKVELERGNDLLSEWVKDQFDEAFRATVDEDVVSRYGDIMNWVYEQEQYLVAAKADFANGADGWLLAYALAHDRYTVVTHEVLSTDIKRKVPIPNVCKHFDMHHIDTYEMLRELKVKLLCSDDQRPPTGHSVAEQ